MGELEKHKDGEKVARGQLDFQWRKAVIASQ